MSPLKLIASIRNSFPGATYVYTHGSCYEFYKILKSVFADAEPYYSDKEGHVYTKIGKYFYDIKGRHDLTGDELTCMEERERKSANKWKRTANFKVVRLLN